MRTGLLIVFLRPPVLGRVKTRLAADIGKQQALDIYTRLMTHTLREAARIPCRKEAWWAAQPPDPDPAATMGFVPSLQSPGDLGKRMSTAFRKGFADGRAPVVIIGTDCPGMCTALLERAFAALGEYDSVIGPAQDGGYYLLGLNKPLDELFRNKAWSSSSVLPATVADLERHGRSCHLLPELVDVDTAGDLDQVQLP